jgi:hypothetical protein
MLVKKVAQERSAQLKEREVRKEVERKEKEHYEVLWEEGRQKKLEREINDHALRQQRNQEMVVILKDQLKAFKEQAKKQGELKAEEALLMVFSIHILTFIETRGTDENLGRPTRERKKRDGKESNPIGSGHLQQDQN